MEKLKRLHSGQSSETRQITFKLINNGSNVGKVMNEMLSKAVLKITCERMLPA
jgi:hypothetical protein